MTFSSSLLATVLSVSLASAHTAMEGHKISKKEFTGDNLPPNKSYHIHLVYDLEVPGVIPAAKALMDKAREHFAELLGPDCPDVTSNGRLCILSDVDYDEPAGGAFVSGTWTMYVPAFMLDATLFWFTQHYKEMPQTSLLLHP